MKLYKREVLNDVWSQFLALALLLALSVDSLNPVKAVSSFLGIAPSVWALPCLAMLLAMLWNNISEVIYRTICVYLNSVLSISFKSIDVVGLDNIPKEGPVIFTGNHANQFVDALVVMMTTPRKMGFLIAETSWHRPVIGDFARIMGCIPVVRPQDSVIPGVGRVFIAQRSTTNATEPVTEYTLSGEGTSFLAQVTPGDQVRFQGKTVKDSGSPVKITRVVSDTELVLDKPLKDAQGNVITSPSPFGILKRVDQAVTFARVYAHLNRGNSLGIFPEGGSHDRTDLLPLKAGVAIMALGVQDKYHVNVPIVPVGLNYFRGHRFRGRVTVEFGTPIQVDEAMLKQYQTNDKRGACNELLHRVEEGMRSVIVTAPNYHVRQLIFAARRLFQRSGLRLSVEDTHDLNRRFAEAYKVLSTLPEASEDLDKLHHQLDEYNKTLKLMGLKDHQVPFIAWWTIHDVIGSALYGFLIFALASIPSFVLNAPVGLVARFVAKAEQKRALAGSKVKLQARDVMLSKKILFSMVAVPVLWLLYFVLLAVLTDWYWSSIVLLLLSFPLFSFFGVRSVEAGIIELKTVRPLFYRLLPQYRKTQDELPMLRTQLQKDVRSFVKKYQGYLGPLVSKEKMDWHAYMHQRALEEEVAQKKAAEAAESTTTATTTTTTTPVDSVTEGDDVAVTDATQSVSDGSHHANEEMSTTSVEDNARDSLSSPDLPMLEALVVSEVPMLEAPASITQDHDLSFLKRSNKSMVDLAGIARSMTCPPGFDEVLQKEKIKERERAATVTSDGSARDD